MNCPICTVALIATERQGIEIDHCPRCRGVWLDRGELDKIVERSALHSASSDRDDDSDWGEDRRKYGNPSLPPGNYPPGGYVAPGPYPPPGSYPPKKKEGFFGRLFDFE